MNYLISFIVGGLFCAIGQIFIDKTRLTAARVLTGYVVIGVILTGVGLYDKIIDFAGAGARVPLTGFGYTLAKGVEEAVKDDGLMGALLGGLKASSAGLGAAIIFGVLSSFVFRSHQK